MATPSRDLLCTLTVTLMISMSHTCTHARSPADPQRSHTHLRVLTPLTRNKRATLHRTRLILGPDEDNKSMSTPPTHRHRGYWLRGQPMRKPCVHVLNVPLTIKNNNKKKTTFADVQVPPNKWNAFLIYCIVLPAANKYRRLLPMDILRGWWLVSTVTYTRGIYSRHQDESCHELPVRGKQAF